MRGFVARSVSKAFRVSGKRGSFFTPPETVRALSGVTISCRPGEFVALAGSNGSGKTTLLRIAAGLLVADEGESELDESGVTYITAQERQFQDRITGRENLRFFARLDGVPVEAIPAATERMGLSRDELERPVWQYSSGMKLRLSLSRIFLSDSTLLVLDEPDRSLDNAVRGELRATLRDLAARHGKAILVATHDLDLASAASRAYVLRRGRVAASLENPKRGELERELAGQGDEAR